MKVLLISPLRGKDPMCGDVIYTETLLQCPPEGVTYEDYDSAIVRGALIEHGNRAALMRSWKEKKHVLRELFLAVVCKLINYLRAWRVIFWEPFRIFTVKDGEYDLVHVHVFNCSIKTSDCPVVVSNALPVRYLYSDARSWSPLQLMVVEAVEQFLARMMGVNLTSYWLPSTSRVIAFTEYTARWYRNQNIIKDTNLDVVPIYLEEASAPPPRKPGCQVGFIAKDFEAKGGPLLLEAFGIVRRENPSAHLTIVGCEPRLGAEELSARGIQWIPFVERQKLLEEVFPLFDVFAYPTSFDGMPLVMIEAMRLGIPIAATDYRGIGGMLGPDGAGLLSPLGDAEGLARNILHLLNTEVNHTFRNRSRTRFEDGFSADAVRPLLKGSYLSALATPAS